MQQQQNQTLSQRLREYQASKTVLFWACAGSVIAATIVGFSWGGWTTGGSAQEMAEDSAAQARQELAAVVCVDRFMAAPDASVQLAALKEMERSYQQGKFVQEGGWAIIVPASSPTDYKARARAVPDLAESIWDSQRAVVVIQTGCWVEEASHGWHDRILWICANGWCAQSRPGRRAGRPRRSSRSARAS
jgi:dienelactone hydrolase